MYLKIYSILVTALLLVSAFANEKCFENYAELADLYAKDIHKIVKLQGQVEQCETHIENLHTTLETVYGH